MSTPPGRSSYAVPDGEVGPGHPAAVVHREIGRRLMEHLDPVRLDPRRILDYSAPAGSTARALCARYRQARVVSACDTPQAVRAVLPAGKRLWRRRAVGLCCALDALALGTATVDLVVSNAVLHWTPDPAPVLRELRRVLKPGGLLLFATPGPDTLLELRDAVQAAGGGDWNAGAGLLDMHDVGDALVRGGYREVVMQAERLTVHYPDLRTIVSDLRALGEPRAAQRGTRVRRAPSQLRVMMRAYERRREPAGLPASVEVVYGLAWVPQTTGVAVAGPLRER